MAVDSLPPWLVEMFPNTPRQQILDAVNKVSGYFFLILNLQSDFNKAVDILTAESTLPSPTPQSQQVENDPITEQSTTSANPEPVPKQEAPQNTHKKDASIRNRSRSRSQPDLPNQYALFSDKIVIESIYKDLAQISNIFNELSQEEDKKKQLSDTVMFVKSKVTFMKEKIEKLQEQKDELKKQLTALQMSEPHETKENP